MYLVLLNHFFYCTFYLKRLGFSNLCFVNALKILADAMGLGKTIMTISLLLAHSEKGGRLGNESTSRSPSENYEADRSPPVKKAKKFPGFDKLGKQQSALRGGGNLIVCPMTLLGQWKV